MYKYSKVKKNLLGGKGDILAEQVVTSREVEVYLEKLMSYTFLSTGNDL